MNKKLFLKLGVLLLSLLFVSCGNDSNSAGEDNSSKTSTSQAVISTESSQEESIKTTSPSVETTVAVSYTHLEIVLFSGVRIVSLNSTSNTFPVACTESIVALCVSFAPYCIINVSFGCNV